MLVSTTNQTLRVKFPKGHKHRESFRSFLRGKPASKNTTSGVSKTCVTMCVRKPKFKRRELGTRTGKKNRQSHIDFENQNGTPIEGRILRKQKYPPPISAPLGSAYGLWPQWCMQCRGGSIAVVEVAGQSVTRNRAALAGKFFRFWQKPRLLWISEKSGAEIIAN